VVADDRTLSILDPRVTNAVKERSAPLSTAPIAVGYSAGQIIVSCGDRTIKVYDERKLKKAVWGSKPATKNGAAAVWSADGVRIVCVGGDEGMTLVDRGQDVGQFRRPKYLAESPWVSAPCEIEGAFALLTENGVMHQFTDVVQFLQAQAPGKDREEDDQ
jgi:hypothetical protein